VYHVWGRGEIYTGFRLENLRVSDHLEHLILVQDIRIKWIFKDCKQNWTGCMWLRIGKSVVNV
jgi:hypothetical protein